MDKKNAQYMDHFNQKTDQYLLCRPDYPNELYDYLAQLVDNKVTVWDCGTGNGQAAKALALRFAKVIGTDISQKQLDIAFRANNIEYFCCPVEKTPIESGTIGLITSAQALHWFNFTAFYQEVRRVSAIDAIFAAWCYSLGTFNNSSLDIPIKRLYDGILGKAYWPKERYYIDEQYQTIPFPFENIKTPEFHITKPINFNQLIGYLSTWSAVKEYQLCQHSNPIGLIYEELELAWGDLKTEKVIRWPLHCLIGKVS